MQFCVQSFGTVPSENRSERLALSQKKSYAAMGPVMRSWVHCRTDCKNREKNRNFKGSLRCPWKRVRSSQTFAHPIMITLKIHLNEIFTHLQAPWGLSWISPGSGDLHSGWLLINSHPFEKVNAMMRCFSVPTFGDVLIVNGLFPLK